MLKGIYYGNFGGIGGSGGEIVKSDTPPSDVGKFWFNTKDFNFYIYDTKKEKWYKNGVIPPLPVTLDILEDGSCDSLFQFEDNLNDDGGVLTANYNSSIAYVTGINGKGVSFDSNNTPNSYVKIKKSDPLYLTFWAYLNNSNNSNKYLLDNRSDELAGTSYVYYTTSLHNSGLNKITTLHDDNKTDVPINTWVFFYVEITASCNGVGFGNYTRNPGSGYSMNGIIDQVRVFNRALSDTDISNVFKAEKTKFLGR